MWGLIFFFQCNQVHYLFSYYLENTINIPTSCIYFKSHFYCSVSLCGCSFFFSIFSCLCCAIPLPETKQKFILNIILERVVVLVLRFWKVTLFIDVCPRQIMILSSMVYSFVLSLSIWNMENWAHNWSTTLASLTCYLFPASVLH